MKRTLYALLLCTLITLHASAIAAPGTGTSHKKAATGAIDVVSMCFTQTHHALLSVARGLGSTISQLPTLDSTPHSPASLLSKTTVSKSNALSPIGTISLTSRTFSSLNSHHGHRDREQPWLIYIMFLIFAFSVLPRHGINTIKTIHT